MLISIQNRGGKNLFKHKSNTVWNTPSIVIFESWVLRREKGFETGIKTLQIKGKTQQTLLTCPGFEPRIPELICMCHILIPDSIPHSYAKYHAQIQFLNQNNSNIMKITKQTFKPQYRTELKRGPRNWGHPELKLKFGETPKIIHINASLICKYKKQIILFQVDLNWIQHCKS